MTLPWKAAKPTEPERQYLVLLSYLPLKRWRRLPWMMIFTWQITRQLKDARGLAGYTLRAQLLQKSFWTLSAWDNEAAMQSFVHATPHQTIMTALEPHMARTSFTRWMLKGSELPPRWDDALLRRSQEMKMN